MSNRRQLTTSEKRMQERLRKIWDTKKKALGLTQEKAADAMGFSTQGAISHYLNGLIPLNTDTVLNFAKLLQVPISDIDENFGANIEHEFRQHRIREPQATYFHQHPNAPQHLPLISWETAAKIREGIDVRDNSINKGWVPTVNSHHVNDFALRISGDSMHNPYGTPTYPNGGIIYIHTSRRAKHRDCIIIKTPGATEADFKQLIIEGGHKFLKPLNPDWSRHVTRLEPNTIIIGIADNSCLLIF